MFFRSRKHFCLLSSFVVVCLWVTGDSGGGNTTSYSLRHFRSKSHPTYSSPALWIPTTHRNPNPYHQPQLSPKLPNTHPQPSLCLNSGGWGGTDSRGASLCILHQTEFQSNGASGQSCLYTSDFITAKFRKWLVKSQILVVNWYVGVQYQDLYRLQMDSMVHFCTFSCDAIMLYSLPVIFHLLSTVPFPPPSHSSPPRAFISLI